MLGAFGRILRACFESPQDLDPALDASQLVNHWAVSTVEIRSTPILDIQVDGDVIATTPQLIRALPSALRVVV